MVDVEEGTSCKRRNFIFISKVGEKSSHDARTSLWYFEFLDCQTEILKLFSDSAKAFLMWFRRAFAHFLLE